MVVKLQIQYIFAQLFEGGRLAQLVEQRPFKAWVLGSNPRPATENKMECSDYCSPFFLHDLGFSFIY